jgi:uncharacterized protein
MSGFEFVWNAEKAEANYRKHRVHFQDAITVFFDPLAAHIPDPDHSENEERLIAIGRDRGGRLLVVVYAERGSTIRIISSRPTTIAERRLYEEGY